MCKLRVNKEEIMGKFKESFSSVYYNSNEDFFSAIECGDNEPTYIGLLEIVRVLKLISQKNRKMETEIPTPIQPRNIENQLCFAESTFQQVVGAS